MFSALKKLVTNEQGETRPSIPSGMQAMGVSLQRKFARGVQYNMRVIIKGDRNTGKTTLFHRLQGGKFIDVYLPTSEIQVASIQWNYKATDDVVKVEVWDVVDKGKPRKRERNTLKIENKETEEEEPEDPCLDASFLDVYKGTNGVVMMLDISKKWTWKYVQKELPKVPTHIPVLVMASFKDQFEEQVVYREEIEFFIKELDRPPGSAHIRVAESSMKNGFGLKYLHSFFNIPFLQLQRETLLQQLQRNQLETDATLEELDARIESEDQDYDMYLSSLSQKRSEKSKGSSSSLNVPNGQTPRRASDTSSNRSSSASVTPAKLSPAHTPSQLTPSSTPPTIRHTQQIQPIKQQQQQAPPTRPAPSPATLEDDQSLGNRFSKWFAPSESKVKQGTRVEDEKSAVIESPAEIHHSRKQPQGKISNVDEFIPDEGIDKGFFDETDSKPVAEPPKKTSIFSFGRKAKPKPKPEPPAPVVAPPPPPDSDSDDGVNPMVAGFQEELDSEDEVIEGEVQDVTPVSPDTEGPDSPFDTFSRMPPRLASKDMSSEDEDGRPVVAMDDDVIDSDDDAPSARSKLSSQHMGWSFEKKLPSVQESSRTAATSSLSPKPSTETKRQSRVSTSSSSSAPETHVTISSRTQGASGSQVTPTQDIVSSEDEVAEVKVLQDCEDISEDDAQRPTSLRTDDGPKTDSRPSKIAQEDSDEEVTEALEAPTTPSQEVSSPASLGLTLQLEDLNFLESVTSKPAKPVVSRNLSRASDEFDVLVSVVQDEDISDCETNTSTSTSSSAKKKKKHKSKDREEDDEERTHKKHKHKKHKDKDREERHPRRDSNPDGEDRKKKKSSSGSSSKKKSSGEKREKKRDEASRGGGAGSTGGGGAGDPMDDNAALEAFLEGF
ncbi:rab-like protein 6 isoform X1 [Lytechinus variegatus]|uniref:rab-like protein 6 isoform X1 n=1 Tax=Lytechinus variegatus TaxID=7654 RepID=UPI001BB25F23|nr:rab-like protein 6 isoform X1 [Lytechinus variegatus]XP_041482161.1 rab-like protein 6 isoform X1 [Lytechinus variegatus]XP_041482162.1 rab-like protein 6 isoform X1 [Lytechinus variegatus]